MVATSRKSPSVKLWAALILFAGFWAWILPTAIETYREFKSMERTVDLLASECAKRGGCTIDTRFDF